MKRILTFFALALLLTNCTREEVVLVEENNFLFEAESFERTVDFVDPDYFVSIEVPLDIFIDPDDMVLVYHLTGTDNQGFDFWRLLPDTVYTNDGQEFQYNFEHNFDFVDIFIEAPSTFNYSSLLPGDLIGQTFRVVILPVTFINSNDIDVKNFNEVFSYLQ